MRRALDSLSEFQLPDEGLTEAERRRLEACHNKVIHQLFTTAQALATEHLSLNDKEKTDGTRTIKFGRQLAVDRQFYITAGRSEKRCTEPARKRV